MERSVLHIVIFWKTFFIHTWLLWLEGPGYRITHVHRENPDQTRGGGLAIVYRDSINVSPRNHNIAHTSFEFQLVNIGLKSRDIVLANIYPPPSSSKSVFLEEFSSLLATLGTDAADRLMICGDFNLPGMSPDKIDDDLADLLNSTGFTQHVNASTRHDSHYTKSSLLDLIITPSTSKFVSTTSVVSSHEISDHDIALANLTTKRFNPPPPPPQRSYQYRDIKNIDLDLFKQNILSSSLFSNPHPTVDGYADQMETEITSVLDKLAPLKTGRRSGPRRARNWLSPEAIEAKKQRRRLERRWKASNAEPDRLSYRAACSSTNKLINKSRAASNVECINEASKNPKRLWSTIKITSSLVSTQWTTLTLHISTAGKFPCYLFLSKDCRPQRVHFSQITRQSLSFWFWSATQKWITLGLHACHPSWSI